jgi:lipid II:glycine glycyltransferase (peptidoglycan interpeptide bridge formation enzyme)
MNTNFHITLNPPVNEWRSFVKQNPVGNIFQTPEMSQVYNATKHHQAQVYACVNPENHINTLVLAVMVNILNGPLARYSRRCILYGGVLPSNFQNNGALFDLLNIVDKSAASRSLFTEIRNIHDLNGYKNDMITCGYNYYDYINYLIPLDRDPEDIFKDFSKTRRKNIRRLEKLNIKVKEVHNCEDINKIYGMVKSTYKRRGVPLADISLFKATYEIMKPKDMAKFYIATLGSEEIACALALFYKNTIYFWYMGTVEKYMKISAGTSIIWELIKWGSQNGYKLLDFLGAGRPGENYGVGEYKRRFGGKEVNYGRFEKVYSPKIFNLCKKAYSFYRSIK